jgi:hypothetical protein
MNDVESEELRHGCPDASLKQPEKAVNGEENK